MMEKIIPSEKSNPQSLRTLMVDDSEDDVLLIIRELKKGGYNPVYERVETAAAMKKALQEKLWDIILCDYKMPKFSAPFAIAVLKEANIDIPLIIISGIIGEETALECMRLGAHDYFVKGKLSRLCPAIARELEEAKVRNKQKQAESQRKAMVEALHQSEEKYRNILENIEDGYYEVDLAGNLTFFNDSMCRLYGYSKDELMGMNYRQYADKETAKKVFQAFNQVYRTGKTIKEFNWQATRKDGAKRYVEVSISLQKDSSDKPAGFRGIIRDVTGRKLAEFQRETALESLRQSEEKYRTIIENIQEGYFEIDLAGNFTFFNDSLCRCLGYSQKELMGMNYRNYMDEKNAKKIFKIYNEIYTTGITDRIFEYEIIRKDGTIRQLEGFASLQRDSSGNPILFRGTIRDITERKQAEQELRESEKYFKEITENSSDIIIITDKNGDIKYGSLSVERFIGYKPEEVIGRSAFSFIHPDDVERAVDHFGKAILTKDSVITGEYRIVRKDGSAGHFAGLGKNMLDNPAVAGFIINMRDITERKQVQEELERTLESLRKAVGVTIQVLVSALEARDPYTAGHQLRVAHLACAIATEMELSQEKIAGIRMAGSIHDIGKLSIPAEILSKPTKLTNLEFSLIKEHSQNGYDMLKDVESPWPLAQIVYQHHERMDGSGYPRKLKGNEILVEARIMAVADVVEAMASHRPYRPGLGIEVALEEIEKNKGIIYDDTVADACLRLFREKNYKLIAQK